MASHVGSDAVMQSGAPDLKSVLATVIERSCNALHRILTVCPEHVETTAEGVARMKTLCKAYTARCAEVEARLASDCLHPASALLADILEDNKHDKHNCAESDSLHYKLFFAHPGTAACVLQDVQNLEQVLNNMEERILHLSANVIGRDLHAFLRLVNVLRAAKRLKHGGADSRQLVALPLECSVRIKVLLGMMSEENKHKATEALDTLARDGSLDEARLNSECLEAMCTFMTREAPERVKSYHVRPAAAQTIVATKEQIERFFMPPDEDSGLESVLNTMGNAATVLREMQDAGDLLEERLEGALGTSKVAGSKRKHEDCREDAVHRAEAAVREKMQSNLTNAAKSAGMEEKTYASKIHEKETDMKDRLLCMHAMLEAGSGNYNASDYASVLGRLQKRDVYGLYADLYNKVANLMRRNAVMTLLQIFLYEVINNGDAESMQELALDGSTQGRLREALVYSGIDFFSEESKLFHTRNAGGIFVHETSLLNEISACLCLHEFVNGMLGGVADKDSVSSREQEDSQGREEVLG